MFVFKIWVEKKLNTTAVHQYWQRIYWLLPYLFDHGAKGEKIGVCGNGLASWLKVKIASEVY